MRARPSAISLNERPRSAISAGPLSGARAAKVARSELDRGRAHTLDRAHDRAGRGRAPTPTATEAEAAVTARIFTSSPMWNMTQPERRTTGERKADREHGETGDPLAQGRQARAQAEREQRRKSGGERGRGDEERGARSRHEPVADAPDGLHLLRVRRVDLDLAAQPAHVYRTVPLSSASSSPRRASSAGRARIPAADSSEKQSRSNSFAVSRTS